MSCRPAAVPRFRGDFSWNQSPRSELASRGKKGMFFRESIADRLSPAHRGRGFFFEILFNLKTAAVGVGTHDLDFPSRMYLPRFGGAFLFCGTQIPASRIALVRTEDLPREMSQCAPQLRLLEGRGFCPHSGLNFLTQPRGW